LGIQRAIVLKSDWALIVIYNSAMHMLSRCIFLASTFETQAARVTNLQSIDPASRRCELLKTRIKEPNKVFNLADMLNWWL
jgi:hypothetical protein